MKGVEKIDISQKQILSRNKRNNKAPNENKY